MRSDYLKGMYHGLPIGLGYLSVSFGFGITAVNAGLSVLEAVGISLTNLTSAGQVAGVAIIAAAGTLIEMIITQLVINIRYSLMAISLSQKVDGSFNTLQRLIVSFGITDEIYAVAIAQPNKINATYMKGLILTPMIGWVSGTLLGAVAGNILPQTITSAMGIMLYGMFIAIVVPPTKKQHSIILALLLAVTVNVILYYCLPVINSGFAVVISALVASVVTALLFPVKEDEQ